MTLLEQDRLISSKLFCGATLSVLMLLSAACATSSSERAKWVAYGYLSPGPTTEAEVIGYFNDRAACDDAAENWKSRQVVGNPVSAECLSAKANEDGSDAGRLILNRQL